MYDSPGTVGGTGSLQEKSSPGKQPELSIYTVNGVISGGGVLTGVFRRDPLVIVAEHGGMG